jgi:hypothetical protein
MTLETEGCWITGWLSRQAGDSPSDPAEPTTEFELLVMV